MNSGPLESVLVKIKELVNLEVKLMTSVQEIMGSIDLLMTVADNQVVPLSSGLKTTSSGDFAENGDRGSQDQLGVQSGETKQDLDSRTLLSVIGSLATQEKDTNIKMQH